MSACNRLDLQTLGSQPITAQKFSPILFRTFEVWGGGGDNPVWVPNTYWGIICGCYLVHFSCSPTSTDEIWVHAW